MARKLSALTGLGALRNLYLKLAGIDKVFSRDAEPSAGDLFDSTAQAVAVGKRFVACWIFAPLAGVAHCSKPVHGGGKRLVSFTTDRTERHCACDKTFYDLCDGLDLVKRDGCRLFEAEQSAESALFLRLIVDELRVSAICGAVARSHSQLQCTYAFRTPEMTLPVSAILVLASAGQNWSAAI